MLRDADDLLFRILRRFAVGVDATTRRAMDCEMRDYWQLGRPSSGTLRAVRVSKPKFRRDETGYSQPCQRHGLLRASFFLAVAET